MQRLTTEQAIVLTGYTGMLCLPWVEFHADAEKRLGRTLFTHEFRQDELVEELRNAYRLDFIAMLPERE